MASYKQRVSGKTGLTFSSSTTPTEDELSQFLVDGLVDVVNRTIQIDPSLAMRFSSTTNATSSVAMTGQIISVMREHDSVSILRPCTPIPAELRYEATDPDSLNFRTKHNPGWYQLEDDIHCVPAASGSGNNDIVVTQIYYDTGLVHGDTTNPDNFPQEYVYLIVLYACMESCLARISFLEANLPEEPILATDIAEIDTQIDNDDPEMAGIVKEKVGQQIAEHNARLSEYNAEVTKSQLEIKTLTDKYLAFSNQYNTAFGLSQNIANARAEQEEE